MSPGAIYLLEVLAERGLTLTLGGGRLGLSGPDDEKTPALTGMVEVYAAELAPAARGPARQWRWRDGHLYVEAPDDGSLYGRADRHPVGAWWWRYEGEQDWRVVGGREAFVLEAKS